MSESQKENSVGLDMLHGPFVWKILVFSIPLMAAGVLQLIYNAADIIVVGKFAGKEALAAVGSTGPLVSLIINLFIGFSVGAGVLVARHIGAGDVRRQRRAVHTAMAFSLVCGAVVGSIGFFCSRLLLEMMDTPHDIIELSSLYLKIYFLGAPGSMVFNFGAAIIRSNGYTKQPLIILTVSGVLNVILNLVFVIGFHMNVAGVAIATITSQYLSAIMIVNSLVKLPNACHLRIKMMRFYKEELQEMIRIGLPAGIQSSLFAISNVVIQSAVNSFGSVVVAGCSASSNIDGVSYTCSNSVAQAAMTFTSQNYGAKSYDNIKKVYLKCLIIAGAVGILCSGIALLFAHQLLGLFTPDEAVVAAGIQRMRIITVTQFICGLMEVVAYTLRGMGKSFEAMVMTLAGSCALRIIWIYTIFREWHTVESAFLSYPVTWGITFVIMHIYFMRYYKKQAALQPE